MTQGDILSQPCQERVFPKIMDVPCIRGEMVRLRPATLEDLPLLDNIAAFEHATTITGKSSAAERAAVHAWVKRSVAWCEGQTDHNSGIDDPELRHTIAWTVERQLDSQEPGQDETALPWSVIGMIFLIDVDAWALSARLQVLLGKDFRGRGYSRDMMPRVMAYGFASCPVGLGLHRIWVGVPEKNTRAFSVYQSLGFVASGTGRDALWDAENGKYQDQHVLDALVDEYDPVRALQAFGMHAIADNPGMEGLVDPSETAQNDQDPQEVSFSSEDDHIDVSTLPSLNDGHAELQDESASHDQESSSSWPFFALGKKRSSHAWWRSISRSRNKQEDNE